MVFINFVLQKKLKKVVCLIGYTKGFQKSCNFLIYFLLQFFMYKKLMLVTPKFTFVEEKFNSSNFITF